jgi:hypothetical protein
MRKERPRAEIFFALPHMPASNDPASIDEAAGGLIEFVSRLSAQLTGHLCVIAEDVESALGLEPTPEPPTA